jgi:hypothetical protein
MSAMNASDWKFIDRSGNNRSFSFVSDFLYRATGNQQDMSSIFDLPGRIYQNGGIWFQRIS